MADITTDVLIVGTGPAGSATAALLSSYGVENMVINRYRWLANTPRAHITNQRALEVLRDLGTEVEADAYLYGTLVQLHMFTRDDAEVGKYAPLFNVVMSQIASQDARKRLPSAGGMQIKPRSYR